jgi:hypothetical protein
MSYLGIMDSWHGDENFCTGDCGLCPTCEQIREEKGEDGYESWLMEQEEGSNE